MGPDLCHPTRPRLICLPTRGAGMLAPPGWSKLPQQPRGQGIKRGGDPSSPRVKKKKCTRREEPEFLFRGFNALLKYNNNINNLEKGSKTRPLKLRFCPQINDFLTIMINFDFYPFSVYHNWHFPYALAHPENREQRGLIGGGGHLH